MPLHIYWNFCCSTENGLSIFFFILWSTGYILIISSQTFFAGGVHGRSIGVNVWDKFSNCGEFFTSHFSLLTSQSPMAPDQITSPRLPYLIFSCFSIHIYCSDYAYVSFMRRSFQQLLRCWLPNPLFLLVVVVLVTWPARENMKAWRGLINNAMLPAYLINSAFVPSLDVSLLFLCKYNLIFLWLGVKWRSPLHSVLKGV